MTLRELEACLPVHVARKIALELRLTTDQLRAWLDRKPPHLKPDSETGSAETAPAVATVSPGSTNPTQDEVQAALNEGSPF